MIRKDYEPLTFTLPRQNWNRMRLVLGDNLSWEVEHKQKFHPYNLDFFQSDMERIQYYLNKAGYRRSWEALEVQIQIYKDEGDWK